MVTRALDIIVTIFLFTIGISWKLIAVGAYLLFFGAVALCAAAALMQAILDQIGGR
jgi:hypothetical protein